MPAIHVERSIRISSAADRVRDSIADFHQWPAWSPWLCSEPSAKLEFFGAPGEIGHGYRWDGQLVGAGGMTIASVDDGRLQMDLEFLRPFKSKAQVMMRAHAIGDAETQVDWHMDSKLPFFLFFMTGMMKTMIGMDYERGLKMLKEYLETGAVNSKTELVGVVNFEGLNFVGVETRCSMAEIGESMHETLPAAHRVATDAGLQMNGPPGAIYHTFDPKGQQCHYTAMVPVESTRQVAGAVEGTIDACRALKVVHTGSYQNLGNAWSTAMCAQRSLKLKPHKRLRPFELYVSDPCETPEEQIVTEIYLPLR
ncbi:MAG: SRPBCC family protein [Planctomycetales bacterium]|nr:SRPBCC family protein [Planctomycetales bacterium]